MIFISRLNALVTNGLREGQLFIGDEECILLLWANAQRNGTIIIEGRLPLHPTANGLFEPLRTFVPRNYIEYTCPGGCRDGHEFSLKPMPDENCPQCGDPRTIRTVSDGKPTGAGEKISKRDVA